MKVDLLPIDPSKGSSELLAMRFSFIVFVVLCTFAVLAANVKGADVNDRPEDREALIAFYNSGNGDRNFRHHWPVDNTNLSHCFWFGISCEVMDTGGGLMQRVVRGIILEHAFKPTNVPFIIPKAFSGLSYLSMLRLRDAPITAVEDGAFESLSHFSLLSLISVYVETLPQLPTSITTVTLRSTPLKSLSFLEGCYRLVTLIIMETHLSEFDISFDQFPSLFDLELVGSRLTELPPGVEKLPVLQMIDLSWNNISFIPDTLCICQGLVSFSVMNNPLLSLPECLGDISTLQLLKIDETLIVSLPESIYKTKIDELIIKNSPLESLPSSLQFSKSLKGIYLEDMPNLREVHPDIFNAPRFSLFSVLGGNFSTMPSFINVTNREFQSFSIKKAKITTWHISEGEILPPFAYLELSNMPLREIVLPSTGPPPPVRDSVFGASVILSNNMLENLDSVFVGMMGRIDFLDLSGNPLRDVTIHLDKPGYQAERVDISNTLLSAIDLYAVVVNARNITTLKRFQVEGDRSSSIQASIDLRESSLGDLVIGFDPTTVRSDLSLNMLCLGQLHPPWFQVYVSPEQIDYQHCSCLAPNDQMFDADEDPPKCVSKKDLLPQGMSIKYDEGLRNHEFSISPGYYPVSIDALELCDLSQYNSYKMCRIMKCPLREVCNPKGGSEYECANGFDRESLMCSQCPSGSYKALGRCQKCPAAPGVVIGANVLCMMVVVVLYLLWAHRRDAIQVRAYSSLSIFLSWVQITFVLTEFGTRYSSAGSTTGGRISEAWSTISHLFIGISPLTLPCVDNHWFETSAWLTFFGPLAVCGLLSFVHLFWLAVARPGRSNVQHGRSLLLYMCASVLQFSYVSIVRTTFTLLNCESLGSAGSFVSSAPFVSCSSSGYLRMRRMAYVSICVFVIGIPCLMLYLVSKGRKKCDDDGVSRATSRSLLLEYGCESKAGSDEDDHTADGVRTGEKNSLIYATMMLLSGAHSDSKAYWSVGVVTARKCLILLVLGLLPQDSAAIPVLVVLLLLLAVILQTYVRPYHYMFDNVLESVSLSMTALNFLAHLVSDVHGVESGKVALSDSVFIVNTVAALLFVICVPLWRWRQSPTST